MGNCATGDCSAAVQQVADDCSAGCINPNACNDVFTTEESRQHGESYRTCRYGYHGGPGGVACPVGQYSTGCIKTGWDDRNIIDCCNNRKSGINDCNPAWVPGSQVCANSIQSFCSANNGANITTNDCRLTCSTSPSASTKAWCDLASQQYCSGKSPDVEYCGCINSKLGPFLCFDANCAIGKSYQTSNITAQLATCKATGCVQVINCISTGSCDISKNQFEQNCPNDTYPNPPSPPNPPGPPPPPPPDTSYIYYVIAGVVVVILLIAIVAAIFYNSYYRSPSSVAEVTESTTSGD